MADSRTIETSDGKDQGARPKSKAPANGMVPPISNPLNGTASTSKPPEERINGFGRHHQEISNDEEDDEDECCIYTYKGDQIREPLAGLPGSFFQLDLISGDQGGVANAGEGDHDHARNGATNGNGGIFSPDMDFLEMDFDPTANCDPESDPEPESVGFFDFRQGEKNGHSEPCIPEHAKNNLGSAPELAVEEPESSIGPLPGPSRVPQSRSFQNHLSERSEAPGGKLLRSYPVRDISRISDQATTPEPNPDSRWLGQDANIFNIQPEDPEMEDYNLQTALYNSIKTKRLLLDKHTLYSSCASDESNLVGGEGGSPVDGHVEKTMIWSEGQACQRQISQIGASACGATALLNVMLALNCPQTPEQATRHIRTRLRLNQADIPDYLLSRSVAGCTHEDLIEGAAAMSGGMVHGRFFHLYPARQVSLSHWLSHWMSKGAVPVATLNLQRCSVPSSHQPSSAIEGAEGGDEDEGVASGSQIPDAWHHQMVFGVAPRGVYMTNPLECVPEGVLWPQLCSPSVLLVRREDVTFRWSQHTDLYPLSELPDRRWKDLNVLGQVVNILRESFAPQIPGCKRVCTQHVCIPASYRSGITLFVRRDSRTFQELISAPELPLGEAEDR